MPTVSFEAPHIRGMLFKNYSMKSIAVLKKIANTSTIMYSHNEHPLSVLSVIWSVHGAG